TAEFRKLYKAAKSDEEQEKLFAVVPDSEAFAKLLVEIAEAHPKDPAAFDAWLWVVKYGNKSPLTKDSPYAKAKAALTRDFLMDPRIGPFCWALRYEQFDSTAVEALREVLAKNPNKAAKAQAAFTLANLLNRRAGFSEILRTTATPELVANWEKYYGKEAIADLKAGD